MKKRALCFMFVLTVITATASDVCESCVSLSKCAQLTSMSKEDQELWMKKYPCNNHHPDDYGTPPGSIPQGNIICCPNEIWGVELKNSSSRLTKDQFGSTQNTPNSSADQNQYNSNSIKPNSNNNSEANKPLSDQWNVDSRGTSTQNSQATGNIEPSRWPTTNTNNYWNQRPDRNKWDIGNQNFYHGNDNRNSYNNRRNYYDNDQRGGGNQGARRNQPGDRSNNQGYGRSENQPGDRSNGQDYGRSVNQPGDRLNNQGYGRRENQPGDRSNGQDYGRSVNQPGDRLNNQGYGRSGNQPGDRSNNQGYGRSVNQPGDRSNNQGYGRIGNQPGDRSINQGFGRSGNQPGDRSNNQGYGRSGNQPGDRSNNQGFGRSGNQPGGRSNGPDYGRNGNQPGDTFGKPGQCDRLTRFPPDPQRGCCGREASDDDRIIGTPFKINDNNQLETKLTKTIDDAPNYNIAPRYNHDWDEDQEDPDYNWSFSSFKEEATNTLTVNNKTVVNGTHGVNSTVTVDNRISGGKATELTQFPWTALLLATFHNGNQQTAFNCGGSLISSRFVLTAGHCVYDAEAVLKSVQVFLAEFDKRFFPRDCKTTPEGQKCIDNISIYSENVILHPRFDENRLLNDIALIKLQSDAPYTEYIRPICLPSINIDNPEHNRLPLTVAGWGRNGQYKTDIKQSTTVHLVPQTDCKKYYPDLTTRHLCAAGYSGEDTCKGDSGGPLMVLYRGVYYVVGVVSGKRTDAPCGTAVPSLYTNVYHYLDWIRSNIGN